MLNKIVRAIRSIRCFITCRSSKVLELREYYTSLYIKENYKKGEINIPLFIIKEQANNYSSGRIKEVIYKGNKELDKEYNLYLETLPLLPCYY